MYEIIDADAHVNPPPMFWEDYLPSRFKGMAPRLEPGSDKEDHDWVVFEGTRKPLNVTVAGNKRVLGRISDVGLGAYDAGIRLEDMATDGVDRAVIFGGGPLGSADNDLFVASFSAYNRWLADFCHTDPHRLIPVAYVPMQDVGESIAMLEEAAARGARAVNIPAFPMSPTGSKIGAGGFAAQLLALTGDPDGPRQYDSEEFDPFWKACVDHDMAVTIHLGARPIRPGQARPMVQATVSKLAMAEPICILIFGAVFDRFPDLRFGSIESGVGWMPWVAEYMDNFYVKHPQWITHPLKMLPSDYMARNIYGSFIRDAYGIAGSWHKTAKNIMWSSDYPHSESSWPVSREEIEKQFAGLSEEQRRPMLRDNAMRFFGLS